MSSRATAVKEFRPSGNFEDLGRCLRLTKGKLLWLQEIFVKGKVFTFYLQRQSRVLLRKLRPQRSQENLNCQLIEEWTTLNGFRCVRKKLIQNKRLKPRESLQKKPGTCPRMSMTKRGSSWSLVDTRPEVIGSQWRYLHWIWVAVFRYYQQICYLRYCKYIQYL